MRISGKSLLGLIGGTVLGTLIALTPKGAGANYIKEDLVTPRYAVLNNYNFKPTENININGYNPVPIGCKNCSIDVKGNGNEIPMTYSDLFFVDWDSEGNPLALSYLGGFRSSEDSFFYKGEKIPNVPIPSAILLLGTGLVGLAAFKRRKLKR